MKGQVLKRKTAKLSKHVFDTYILQTKVQKILYFYNYYKKKLTANIKLCLKKH